MDSLHLEMISEPNTNQANLTVMGLGGAGGNAIRRMIETSLGGVKYVVANTDSQALDSSPAKSKLQIGGELTGGLGSGGDSNVGRAAAEESRDDLAQSIDGADMVFITCGMGGGTGTGAAPVVAALARAAGALTVAIVTKPFIFEGQPRMKVADDGLDALREHVDTLIVIPNQRLLSIASAETTYVQALHLADEVLVNATTGISDIILRSGDINVDFADVRAVMANRGNALMGSGRASGPDRAVQAATTAISSPLLNDVSIDGAEALLVNITGGDNMTLHEVADATSVIVNAAGEQAKVIFGTVVDPSMGDEVSITLIATGFGDQEKRVLPLGERSDEASNGVSDGVVKEPEETPSAPATNEAAEVLTKFAEEAATAVGDDVSPQEEAPGPKLDASWDEPEEPRKDERARSWGVLRDRPTFMKRQVE